MEEKKIVAVSGGFDPVHIGHVRLFKEAKALGDKLIIILNNDNWLRKKKGSAFMPEDEKVEILKSLACVDDVVLTNHVENTEDMSVCETLARVKPDIFANGGDRKSDNIPEYQLCEELGIEMIFNVGGGKIQSSSWLVEKGKDKASSVPNREINFQNKKMIIADVDDTICDSCQQISEEMAEQISKMIQQGYEFAFISGTKHEDLMNMISSRIKEKHHLLATTGTDYAIVENNASKNIYNLSFTDEEKKEIMEAFEKLISRYNIESMTTKEDQLQDRESQITLSAIGRHAPSELKARYDPEGEKRKSWIEYLKTVLGEEKYDLKIGGTTSIDVTRKGLDKEWGIRKFAQHHTIPLNNILFFGDKLHPGGNDFAATKIVDCIAVRNPQDTLRELKQVEQISKIIIDERPWGKFEQFTSNELSTVKILTVEANKRLSLQSHEKREELWVALDDNVVAEIDDVKKELKSGEKVFIPKNTKHRLSSESGGRILEISFGEFAEEDNVRYEDDFGRVGKY